LLPVGAVRQVSPTGLGSAATLVLAATFAVLLPTTTLDASAQLSLRPIAQAGSGEQAEVTLTLSPATAADDAAWFHVLAWQGARPGTAERTVRQPLRQLEDGSWMSEGPVPVDGTWKTIVRLHRGATLAAVPIHLPADAAIPAPEVPADPSAVRPFVADHELLQREARDPAAWATRVWRLAMLAFGSVWLAAFAVGTRRLRRSRPESTHPVSSAARR
jgi:hypothetical protein